MQGLAFSVLCRQWSLTALPVAAETVVFSQERGRRPVDVNPQLGGEDLQWKSSCIVLCFSFKSRQILCHSQVAAE